MKQSTVEDCCLAAGVGGLEPAPEQRVKEHESNSLQIRGDCVVPTVLGDVRVSLGRKGHLFTSLHPVRLCV